MFALYFNDSQGAREFVTTLDELSAAMNVARLMSRQDPRDVVVIENRALGDTIVRAVFRKGQQADAMPMSLLMSPDDSPSPYDNPSHVP